MESLILLSGGLDSTVSLFWAQNQGHKIKLAISFDYESKHNERERFFAMQLCASKNIPHKTIQLNFSSLKSDLLQTGGEIPDGHYADPIMSRTVVPFRNGILLSFATGIAESIGAQNVVIGNHFGDDAIYPDCRASFIEPMRDAIKHGTGGKVNLLSPFLKLTKAEIVSLGAKLNVPFDLTYSCYKGRKNHCGKCGTCTERIEAFNLANIKDPTIYEI